MIWGIRSRTSLAMAHLSRSFVATGRLPAILLNMGDAIRDPLALGQRVVSILETGARTATYKLATLMALVDYSVENLPGDPEGALAVPVRDVAMRVVELYWPQMRTFENKALRQSTQPVAKIPDAVLKMRAEVGAGESGMAFVVAAERAPDILEQTLGVVSLTLVRQPLHRLQKLPNGGGEPFLYDDSWMHDAVSRRAIETQGSAIHLFPGVAFALARLSGLLRPALELLWVDDVRRMNRWLEADVPDVAGHLFGRDRISLAPARDALRAAFGARCFYCGRQTGTADPVDHVLPWSRVGLDGLANLVVACRGCNADKSYSLPSLQIIDRVLQRDRDVLEQVACEIRWPVQYSRVSAAARGLYLGQPEGVITWDGYKQRTRLDLNFPAVWLQVDR